MCLVVMASSCKAIAKAKGDCKKRALTYFSELDVTPSKLNRLPYEDPENFISL